MNHDDLRTKIIALLGDITSTGNYDAYKYRDNLSQAVIELKAHSTGLQIWIASDGLKLDSKINIEQELNNKLDHHQIGPYAVLFKKLEKSPTPITNKTSAFGIQLAPKSIDGVKHIIAVASGKGGVGKSTVSTNLAAALTFQGKKVGILDADIYGPSGPTMLGVKGKMGVAPGGRILPLEAHGIKCASFGFISDAENPVMWRGPMVGKAIKQLCFDVEWGELDYLIIDLPPGTGDVQLSLAQSLAITGSVVVTTPQDIALIDAHKAVTMFEKLDVPIFGLVENMAYHRCKKCGHEENIFGDELKSYSRTRGYEVLARIPLDISVRTNADAGTPTALDQQNELSQTYLSLAQKVTELQELG